MKILKSSHTRCQNVLADETLCQQKTLALAAQKRLPGQSGMPQKVLEAFGGIEQIGAARVNAKPATAPDQPALVDAMKPGAGLSASRPHGWCGVFPAMMCG